MPDLPRSQIAFPQSPSQKVSSRETDLGHVTYATDCAARSEAGPPSLDVSREPVVTIPAGGIHSMMRHCRMSPGHSPRRRPQRTTDLPQSDPLALLPVLGRLADRLSRPRRRTRHRGSKWVDLDPESSLRISEGKHQIRLFTSRGIRDVFGGNIKSKLADFHCFNPTTGNFNSLLSRNNFPARFEFECSLRWAKYS